LCFIHYFSAPNGIDHLARPLPSQMDLPRWLFCYYFNLPISAIKITRYKPEIEQKKYNLVCFDLQKIKIGNAKIRLAMQPVITRIVLALVWVKYEHKPITGGINNPAITVTISPQINNPIDMNILFISIEANVPASSGRVKRGQKHALVSIFI